MAGTENTIEIKKEIFGGGEKLSEIIDGFKVNEKDDDYNKQFKIL